MYRLLRPLLLALTPDDAHALGMQTLLALETLDVVRDLVAARMSPPAALGTSHLGLKFRSPVGLAGGFDKNAVAPRALAALGFGFLELGTVTAEAQEPNPRPNLFRLPDDRALVNRLGFPNDGATAVAARFARAVESGGSLGIPVGFSIGKSRSVAIDPIAPVVADYLASFRAVRPVSDFVVVNVSSPNTNGLRALQGAALASQLLTALARENDENDAREPGTRVPLLLKISPDLSEADLVALLDVVRETKLDGVVATNTTLSRRGLVSRPSVVEAVGAGGLSGPPLRSRVLEVLPLIRERLGPAATVIAVGGVGSAADVRTYMNAGADLVQLYTSFIYEGPGLPSRIARDLAREENRR